MMTLLWVPATVLAALLQTARNAMQRQLIQTIGTLGATQVRFLYGLPFAAAMLAAVCLWSGVAPPAPNAAFLAYTAVGGLAQIVATALMLAAMRQHAFALTIAYTKTEPIQVAVFGLLVLGDTITALGVTAILIATAGVILMSRVPPGAVSAGLRPALLGIAAGAFFALSAVALRGGILHLESGSALLRASTTLTWSLALQSVLLVAWLGVTNRDALTGSLRVWRSSLTAGFMGAAASQFWFIGFALTSAANVRTLGLIEVVFAQIVSRRMLAESISRNERIGLGLVLAGVALLLLAAR